MPSCLQGTDRLRSGVEEGNLSLLSFDCGLAAILGVGVMLGVGEMLAKDLAFICRVGLCGLDSSAFSRAMVAAARFLRYISRTPIPRNTTMKVTHPTLIPMRDNAVAPAENQNRVLSAELHSEWWTLHGCRYRHASNIEANKRNSYNIN